jgi:hypothetical protein
MAENSRDISNEQRTRLLRAGIVLIDCDLDAQRPWAVVAGAGVERIERAVADEFGAAIDLDIAGDVPRALMPRRCVGHMEREAGRLQLRFVLRGDEHVDDIVLAEDDESVVVYGIVCTSVSSTDGGAWEGPWHVYLDRPLGDRVVIDGVTGSPVPYKNIFAELRDEWPADTTPHLDEPESPKLA